MESQKRNVRVPRRVQRARRRLTRGAALAGIERLQKAICDRARLQIVQALTVGPLSVKDLAAVIDRTPAATSQHLRVLREVGLVEGRRRGGSIYYALLEKPAGNHLRAVLGALEAGIEE
jgi:DNA-binding transcriptional ArsR family regulator